MMLNIALPKGRLGEKVYDMFEAAGYACQAIRETNRKLIFENPQLGVRYFWVKPSDVSIYVERGAADIGVAGKDILLEYAPSIYELLDLRIGRCRMAVAGPKDFYDDGERTHCAWRRSLSALPRIIIPALAVTLISSGSTAPLSWPRCWGCPM